VPVAHLAKQLIQREGIQTYLLAKMRNVVSSSAIFATRRLAVRNITKEALSAMRTVKSGTICDEFALLSRTRVKLAGL